MQRAPVEPLNSDRVNGMERRNLVPIPSCECLSDERPSEGESFADEQLQTDSQHAWHWHWQRHWRKLLHHMMDAGATPTTRSLVTMGFDMRGMAILLVSMVYWMSVLVFNRHIFPRTIEKTNPIFVTLICAMALWLCVECLALRFLVHRAVVSPVCGRFVAYWKGHRIQHRKCEFDGFQSWLMQFLLQIVGISLLFLHDFSFHIVVLACDFGIVTAIAGSYREVLKFIEAMSRSPGEDLLEAIHERRHELATSTGGLDGSFWQDALQAYRHMEHGLFDLFEVLSPSYAMWLAHRYIVVVVLAAIPEVAFSQQAENYQALAAGVGGYIAVKAAANTLLQLRKISTLYSDCITYVGGHAKPPTLYSAASQVGGNQENIEIDRFLRYLERSKAGAQIFGQKIDGAMLAKLFATVGFFSYGVKWVADQVSTDVGSGLMDLQIW